MRGRGWLYLVVLVVLVAVPLSAQSVSPFTRTLGFATKTGFRGVFTWSASRPVTAVVRYGSSAGNLDQTAQALPGLADTAGLAIAQLTTGQTYYWAVEDTATGQRSAVQSLTAKNAYTNWNGNTYTINLLVQLDLDSLPPEIPADQALADIAAGINIFAERLYDAMDGYARLGTVVITDTNTEYAGNVPFQTMPVCADGANLADVLVETTVPLDSHTFGGWSIDDPCTSFYVGRIGQLIIPWQDDLHFGAVSVHEMLHYAMNAPDLYAEGSADSGVIADCRNTSWDGSVMHNTGGYKGQWEMTELDRNPTLTPCNMGNNPYSWDNLRVRYTNVPLNPDGPIDHIIDEKARGNADGGALDIWILNRQPDGTSTLTPYTPNDAVPACSNLLPQVVDGTGDSTGAERVPGSPAPNEDSLDVKEGFLTWDAASETVTFHIKVKDLTALPPIGALGQIFRFNFNYDGKRYQLRASRDVLESRSLAIADLNAVPATGTTLASGLPGAFDIDRDEITIGLPWSVFGQAVPGAPRFAPEREFSKFEVIAMRYYGPALALTSDTAKGFCKYLVAQDTYGPNDAPVANADTFSMTEDVAGDLNVLANDSDANGDPLYVRSATPARGTATINANGTIRYTPPANYSGPSFIEYTIGDRRGGTATARASITIAAAQDPPDARDDDAPVFSGTPARIPVLTNDSDLEGDTLTITGVTQGLLGKVTQDGGTVTYTPGGGFLGTDSFNYTVSDGHGGSDTARVTVVRACAGTFADDFEPVPDAGWQVQTVAPLPQGVGNSPVPGWTHLNDPNATDPTNHAYYSGATDAHASRDDRLTAPAMRIGAGARLTFQHRFATEGTYDGGVLEVSTDNGATWSDVVAAGGAFVRGGYNDSLDAAGGRPGWGGISASFPANETVEVNLGALANKLVTLRWRLFTDSNSGNAGWWIDDVRLTNVAATDCGPAINRKPDAVNDSASTGSGKPVSIAVLANDSDPDEDTLTITAVSDPPNGAVTNHGGAVTYQPDAGFGGNDVFTYTISDGHGGTDTASVTVRVNKAPVGTDDNVSTAEDRAATFEVLANDSDADGDALRVASVTQPIHGSASINSDGSIAYVPAANYNGRDSFTYTVSDGADSDSASVSITVTAVNDAPTAVNDTATTRKNNAVTVNVLTNDSDVEGDALRIDSVGRPANGSVSLNADGTIRYRPRGGFTGTDAFTYTVSDAGGGVATATVTITVTAH